MRKVVSAMTARVRLCGAALSAYCGPVVAVVNDDDGQR